MNRLGSFSFDAFSNRDTMNQSGDSPPKIFMQKVSGYFQIIYDFAIKVFKCIASVQELIPNGFKVFKKVFKVGFLNFSLKSLYTSKTVNKTTNNFVIYVTPDSASRSRTNSSPALTAKAYREQQELLPNIKKRELPPSQSRDLPPPAVHRIATTSSCEIDPTCIKGEWKIDEKGNKVYNIQVKASN